MKVVTHAVAASAAAAVLLLAGCSSTSDDPATEVSPEPSTSAAGTTGSALPASTVTAVLGQPYDRAGGTPDADSLPASDGSVTALWYRAGDVFAVYYQGLAIDVNACPGNSVLIEEEGFDHVSNAPLPDASCDSFPTLIENTADQGVQICEDRVSYLTHIPSDQAGVLFASLEAEVESAGGGVVGLTSTVEVDDPESVPEVEVSALAC